jgi:hypothetical protein
MQRRNAMFLTSTLLCLLAVQMRAASNDGADAKQLVREVIQNEIKSQAEEAGDEHLWSYRELTRQKGKELLYEYCQTKYGTIHRLLAVNGRPLSPSETQAEDKRIQKFITSPDAIPVEQKKRKADAEEERRFLGLFADAFHYQAEKRQGELVQLLFTPDPDFRPSGIEERALHNFEGTIVLNVKQKRLVSVNGRLMSEVKFLGGLAGHLDEGGTFSIQSENVAPGDWELKSYDVQMTGKVLFFKTLTVQEHIVYSRYTPVPANTTLAQAAERLRKDANP